MATSNADASLARGGGNAAAAGIAFQAGVAAHYGSALLGERMIDRPSGLGRAVPVAIRCETEAPIDDILIETSEGGFIFIQAKTSVQFSRQLDSPLGKTVEQFVRQWILCAAGVGTRRWDRPLAATIDRFLLAVGPTSSATITQDLANALRANRTPGSAPLPDDQRKALDRFQALLDLAWQKVSGKNPYAADLRSMLCLVDIVVFDFEGADRSLVVEAMRDVVQINDDAASSFSVLRDGFTRLMSSRFGVDAPGLRDLIATSLRLKEPPSYRSDVVELKCYSDRTRSHLEHFEETIVGGQSIRIDRKCTQAVLTAAASTSLLLVGDPGAGKSAVISSAAARLRSDYKEVIELAVDRLPVESAEGLQQQLGLTHRVMDVLENWPGNDPAYLFIDALDATRGGRSEGVFRWLISEVLSLPQKRWRVIASIRSFDLRMGQQLAELFAGSPPDPQYSDKAFGAVTHIHIPIWEHDELEQLLLRAPPIQRAVRAGGARMSHLARTPFNTRLLADLLSTGVEPEAFREIKTQSQLLDLYWAHRVSKHGLAAEKCLQDVVGKMVEARALQAERLAATATNADALQNLLHESVLVNVSRERYVAFRHDILFDFAASRTYLDLLDVNKLADVLGAERGLGLILGPALIFALNDIWENSEPSRDSFWRAMLVCVGRPVTDPVARSIAARVACEMPSAPDDVTGLLKFFHNADDDRERAKVTVAHVVGSLSVRVDDGYEIGLEAWSYFAGELGQYVEFTAWPLRTLLFLLTERNQTTEQRAKLGSASRDLLRYSLSNAQELVTPAIGFVADTFVSDPAASRRLLSSLFSPERFNIHGDDDIPWLTRKLSKLLPTDPEFVVEIYEKTFAGAISDEGETTIGNSRILPLRSNRRQDYQMSYWNLKEFFPKFVRTNPDLGTKAYIKAVEGYVFREHPPAAHLEKWSLLVGGLGCSLQEDWSYIWASNPNDQHGDNAVQIAAEFWKWLSDAPEAEALRATEIIISNNEVALVWARLFMVAAQRAEILGPVLWPYATSFPFLWASDTRKDAIDLIAATYPQMPESERVAFEANALSFDFNRAEDPQKVREYILQKLFATIGADSLLTAEARRFATIAVEETGRRDYQNERFDLEVRPYSPEDFWQFREQNVDTDEPENVGVLVCAKSFKDDLQQQNRTKAFPSVGVGVSRLSAFLSEIDSRPNCHPLVNSYAMGIAAEGLETIASMFEKELSGAAQLKEDLIALVGRFAKHPSPEVGPETEETFEKSPSWGSPAARVSAAHAALTLARIGASEAEMLRPVILQLLEDPHPAVRMSTATWINGLWLSDRRLMWELAERVTSREKNSSVLSFFANSVLARLVHSDPAHVELLTMELRVRTLTARHLTNLREQIGGLISVLWVSHARLAAKGLLQQWLADVSANDEELEHAVAALRGAVVLGYETRADPDVQIRKRSIEFARWVAEATTTNLEAYFANQLEDAASKASVSAKLLGHLLNQFYFSSGAFRHGPNDGDTGIVSIEAKREFLGEVAPILARVTDVGSPQTIHYLIDLLDFLMDADAAAVFGLTARALLGAGKRQGYQFESLGADQVVKMIGRFLADHRGLFDDPARRQTLVKCLDAFIEVGWPSARRLLYRLPELLQ